MRIAIVTLVLIGSISWGESVKDLPASFPRCKRFDPNAGECILNATITLRPILGQGVPEIKLPPIDPLIIPVLKIEQGTSAVNYKVALTNITITGLHNYDFNKIYFDPVAHTFNGTVTFNTLFVEANYEINGQILIAPIQGKGVMKGEIGKAVGILDQRGRLFMKKGKEYLEPVETKVTLQFEGDAKIKFDGLFNGNQALSDATNQVLQDNANDLILEIKPALETVVSDITHQIVRKVTTAVTYDKLFPV